MTKGKRVAKGKECIHLYVASYEFGETCFRVVRSVEFRKVFEKFYETKSVEAGRHFSFFLKDYTPIDPRDTPKGLGLENGDKVLAFVGSDLEKP